MRIFSYLSILPIASTLAISASLTIPELARSVTLGARTALSHSHSLISSTAQYLGHRKPTGKRLKRQGPTCVVRTAGGQVPLGGGYVGGNGSGSGNGTSSSASGASGAKTSPAVGAAGTSKAATATPTSSAPPSGTTTASADPAGWNLVQTYSGPNFFDQWDFWTSADPTHGTVSYVSGSDATSLGLTSANESSAVMRVSTAQPLPSGYANRPSIRITTQRSFTGGLLVGDIAHMPVGCGIWPAFWSNGPNWPAGGEIDIIEGVADATHNTASIHTNPGCTIPTDYGASGTLALSGSEGYDCAAEETNDSGCGMTDTTPNNYGTPFNNAGGGVFAMKWDSTGIAVYFWSRANIPEDVSSGLPNPAGWPEPIGAWPAAQCSPYEFFYQNVAIFDTTLCGDWAGNAWSSVAYGASESCAQSTGYSTCAAYVAAEGAAFADAYWEVYSVKLYQQAGMGA